MNPYKRVLYALIITIISLIALSLLIPSCKMKDETTACSHAEANGIYYWKTVFDFNETDNAFFEQHKVRRMYMRMFDVTLNAYPTGENDTVIPNATVNLHYYCDLKRENTELEECEIVPVVYITLEALKASEGSEQKLAKNIVDRVWSMVEYNDLPDVTELQLDCDWTTSTQSIFFKLCEEVKAEIANLNLNLNLNLDWELSSTIRLHQLRGAIPPVDRGVLMVYNTGNFKDPDADNSIINIEDVKPYLKYLPDYKLHLDVAYPTYSWQLIFHRRQFAGLTSEVEVNDTTRFVETGKNLYKALRDIPHKDRIIRQGDIIRVEQSSIDEILPIKELIEEKLKGKPHSNIIYHLDTNNLSKYSTNEIDSLFTTDF